MTLPDFSPLTEDDAGSLQRLATGNQHLVTNPGLLQALIQHNATAAQAGAINQFMGGLDAQRRVALATQSGTKITLSGADTQALDAMGVPYGTVQLTHQDVLNANGTSTNPATGETVDSQGNIVNAPTAQDKPKSSGWFSSGGSFLHHLTHNAVTSALGEGWHATDSAISSGLHTAVTAGQSVAAGPSITSTGLGQSVPQQHAAIVSQQKNDQMKALGYDPSNPLSVIAYNAKGYAHSDTSDLADNWDTTNPQKFGWTGEQAVIEAEKYAADPQNYMKSIINDPSMTPEEKNARMTDPAWGDLVKEVNGRQSNIGNDFAGSIGLDPVKDPKAFAYTSAGVDTAASFLLDPVLAVGAVAKAVKVSQIGLDGIGDSESILKILDPANGAMNARKVQAGWTSLLTDGKAIREGLAAGTDEGSAQAAGAYAHARATTPGIADLLPDIIGSDKLTGEYDAAGKAITASGAPIESLQDMASYLASKNALLRLTRGKAATESGLMPGAMTPFMYRWLKGNAAGAIAERSTTLNLSREADAAKLIVSPTDAVDGASGASLADLAANFNPDTLDEGLKALTESGGLASQARATSQAAANGEALFNLRKYGNIAGDASAGGWASPAAVAARLKLAGQRLSSFLPRNNVISLGDADSAEKVYRFGLQYLNKGDAALFGAKFVAGHEGDQKAVIDAIVQQTAHAAGLGTTDAGRELIDQMSNSLNANQYGHIGNDMLQDLTTGAERPVAIHPSQVRSEFYLPSFKRLQMAAAKAGVWQNTAGRAFNTQFADTFMDYERMAMLMKPNVGIRNIVEPFLNLGIRGKFLDMLHAKQVLNEAPDGVQTSRKMILDKAISAFALDRAGRVFRAGFGRSADPETEAFQREFTEGPFSEEFRPTILGYGDQMARESVDPLGVDQADLITRDGLKAQRYQRVGFGMAESSGQMGAERYAHALGVRYNQYPDLTRAVLENVGSGKPVDGIVDALNQPGMRKVVDKMMMSRQYADANGVEQVVRNEDQRQMAIRRIAISMKADAAYLFSNESGEYLKPLADHMFETGRAPQASWIMDHLTDEMRPKAVLAPQYRAVAANGPLGFIRTLLDATGHGYKLMVENPIKRTSTEPVFLMHYGEQRVILKGVQADIAKALAEPKLKALGDRHDFESIEHGMKTFDSPEAKAAADEALADKHGLEVQDAHEQVSAAAQRAAHELAVKRAYNATEQVIDDPGLKTQADIVGRNFLMFSRAMQAFVRRWGGLAIEDPTSYRRAFLAMEGMNHAGITYGDSYGNVNFIYPGSDLTLSAMHHVATTLGVPGLAQYPISGGLNGQLGMIAPGIDNPLRFSMSPLLNMPFHAVETLLPGHRTMLDEVDRALNGQDSQGKSWYSELVPGALGKWTAATNSDPRSSAMASAMRSAITNMAAVDPDGSKGIFLPANATASEKDLWMSRLQTQVKSQLYLRAAFGEFAPAPPGIPSEDTGNTHSDPAFSAIGVRNLSDEYKMILNDANGNRAEANLIFTANHPDRAVYTVPTSQSTTNKAYLPATGTADRWLESNLDFINSHKAVAAYFVPQDSGPFDLHAYRTQMELGMRQARTPQEFYDQYRITTAEQQFYASKAVSDGQVNSALQGGNKALAAKEKANFTAWKTGTFNPQNPLFADKQAQWADKANTAKNALVELQKIVEDPGFNAPANVTALTPALGNMLQAWNTHESFTGAHKGSQALNVALRKGETAQFEDYMLHAASSDPNLADIYNGVFRVLDSNLQQAVAQ